MKRRKIGTFGAIVLITLICAVCALLLFLLRPIDPPETPFWGDDGSDAEASTMIYPPVDEKKNHLSRFVVQPTGAVIEERAGETQREAKEDSGSEMCDSSTPVDDELESAEIEMLACVIYQEAGGDGCTDECRRMVGDVVLNRMLDERFPDTMREVLTQYGQFGAFYWTGVVWPERSDSQNEEEAVQRAYEIANELMYGKHSSLYGAGYIWLAEFPQGRDVVYIDKIYFGR